MRNILENYYAFNNFLEFIDLIHTSNHEIAIIARRSDPNNNVVSRVVIRKNSKSGRVRYFLMFSAGAIASMTNPSISALLAYFSGFTLEALVLDVIWTLNALFTIYFSSKAGDFHKAFKAWKKYSQVTPT